MRKWLALAVVLVLVAAEAHAAVVERFPELSWIPADAEMVLAFEDRDPGAAPLLARMRDELLFATRMDERLPRLAQAADSLHVQRLIAAVVRLPDDGKGAVALLHGPFSMAAVESALGDSHQQTVIFVDKETVAFGELPAIEHCRTVRNGRGASVLTDTAIRPLLDEISSRGQAWGLLLPQWLHLPEAPKDSQFPYHGVREGLAGIRWSTFWAQLSSSAAFQMSTRVSSDDDALVLADSLRAFLASFRLNPEGAPAVLKALGGSRVLAEGPTVSLQLDLSAEALGRLRHNDASRRLLSWRLGDEEREAREKVGEILARLDLARGNRAADVGSGLGFFTIALARRVGETGRVFAVDIDERILGELRRRAADGGFPQIEVVLGAADDPKLPADSLDAVLIVNSYHEMPRHKDMLDHLWRSMKPGGRLALVEPFAVSRRSESRESQEKAHLIAPEILERDLRDAGFEVLSRIDEFVSGSEEGRFESFLLARRPLVP
jgi:ubiquinone/menaquinone biosynthesis C-methylase UbiE